MSVQTLVPIEKAMKVVNLLKAEIAGRKKGYAYVNRTNDGLIEALEEVRALLEKDDVDGAREAVDHALSLCG